MSFVIETSTRTRVQAFDAGTGQRLQDYATRTFVAQSAERGLLCSNNIVTRVGSGLSIMSQSQSPLLTLPYELRLMIIGFCAQISATKIAPNPCCADFGTGMSWGTSTLDSSSERTSPVGILPTQSARQLHLDACCPVRSQDTVRTLLAMNLTCRQLYYETMPVFYSSVEIEFTSPHDFLSFCSTHSITLPHLRKIHLHMESAKSVAEAEEASAFQSHGDAQILSFEHSTDLSWFDRQSQHAAGSIYNNRALTTLYTRCPGLTHLSLTWPYRHMLYSRAWPLSRSTLIYVGQFRDLDRFSLSIEEPPPGPIDCGFRAADEGRFRLLETIRAVEKVLSSRVCRRNKVYEENTNDRPESGNTATDQLCLRDIDASNLNDFMNQSQAQLCHC